MELSTPTIENDIAELERRLEEKKAALEHERSDKELVHETVGEKIQEHVPSYTPSEPSLPAARHDPASPSYLTPELQDKVRQVVDIVFSKSLEEGVKEAAKSGNPALIDAFHDILTDELYSKLLEKRKLDAVE